MSDTAPERKQQTIKTFNPDAEIPVGELRFFRRGGIDIPGTHGASVVKPTTQENKGIYELAYIPRIRHHRITYTPPPGRGSVEVLFVHEAQCAWKPAAEAK